MIKVNLEHSISQLKIPQLRVSLESTILALKQNIEKRYGSEPNYVRLALRDKDGQTITQMEEQLRTLDFYGVKDGMVIFINDLNPNSIHKEISNLGQIQKYVISEQSYDQLPQNFRKWKKNYIQEHPNSYNSITKQLQICEPDYLKSLAETMKVGMRCQRSDGSRGVIKYIGRCLSVGYGFFIGIELDQSTPEGGNGSLLGIPFFQAEEGKGVFERPNAIEVGDFPKIEESDEI